MFSRTPEAAPETPRTGPPLPAEAVSVPDGIDTQRPNIARVYDYLLGGKDNFEADRKAAEKILAEAPQTRIMVRENRAFLGRVVKFLAKDAGISQFLDIGTGLPAAGNVHEIAQAINPEARTVYVDNDPVVLCHARAMLATTSKTNVLKADLRQPQEIIAQTQGLLDLSQPVAVLLVAILHFLPDGDNPRQIVRSLLDAMPSGSYLALTHVEYQPQLARAAERHYKPANGRAVFRTREQIAVFFDEMNLIKPGLVHVQKWRPERELFGWEHDVAVYGGVAFKP
ncbi:SAM-dependent methyltransferase [Nonomuraea sp. NPDC003754]